MRCHVDEDPQRAGRRSTGEMIAALPRDRARQADDLVRCLVRADVLRMRGACP